MYLTINTGDYWFNFHLSIEIASILAENRADIDIVYFEKNRRDFEINRLRTVNNELDSLIRKKNLKFKMNVLEESDKKNLNTIIIGKSGWYDLVILGLIRRQNKSWDFLSKKYIDIIDKPVVLVRATSRIHNILGNIL